MAETHVHHAPADSNGSDRWRSSAYDPFSNHFPGVINIIFWRGGEKLHADGDVPVPGAAEDGEPVLFARGQRVGGRGPRVIAVLAVGAANVQYHVVAVVNSSADITMMTTRRHEPLRIRRSAGRGWSVVGRVGAPASRSGIYAECIDDIESAGQSSVQVTTGAAPRSMAHCKSVGSNEAHLGGLADQVAGLGQQART
jgi:hypothetical protein